MHILMTRPVMPRCGCSDLPRAGSTRASGRSAADRPAASSQLSSTVSVSAVSRATSAAGGPQTRAASSPRSARAVIPAKTAAAAKGWLATSYGVPSTGQQAPSQVSDHQRDSVDVQRLVHQSRRELLQQTGQQLPAPAPDQRCTRTARSLRCGAAG